MIDKRCQEKGSSSVIRCGWGLRIDRRGGGKNGLRATQGVIGKTSVRYHHGPALMFFD